MLQFANTVYITDLYVNQIHRVNASTGESLSAIPFSGWSEGIILDSNNKIWVSNATRGKVMKIDPTSNQIIDSIAVGDVPRDLKLDNQGNVWVLCEGQTFPNESAGSLWCFNPSTHAIVRSLQFSSNAHPSRLISIPENGELLFLKNGVCKINTNDSILNETPFIAQGSRFFYGLGYNTIDSTIWVSDAKDYQQSGDALVYRANDGAFIKSYSVGIIPSSFYFY
jgi:DNA-binding beta-propeller fold protein YncE